MRARGMGLALFLGLVVLAGGEAWARYDPLEVGMPPTEAERTKQDRAARWFEFGELYYYGDLVPQSYEKAAVLYSRAAEYGHAEALFSLGYMHAEGLGVQRDEAVAVSLFRRGAQAGSVLAMHNLAYLYDVGAVVPQDDQEAFRLYRQAAERGDTDALVNLAIMLDEGRGTTADPGLAASYLVAAFVLGVSSAEEWLINYSVDWGVNTRREVQRILRDAGLYQGVLDGQIGEAVKDALYALRGSR